MWQLLSLQQRVQLIGLVLIVAGLSDADTDSTSSGTLSYPFSSLNPVSVNAPNYDQFQPQPHPTPPIIPVPPGPVPTNKFWSSLVYGTGSSVVFPQPFAVRRIITPPFYGIGFNHCPQYTYGGVGANGNPGFFTNQYIDNIAVTTREFVSLTSAPSASIPSYSNFGTNLHLHSRTLNTSMDIPIVQGMAYFTVNIHTGTPVIWTVNAMMSINGLPATNGPLSYSPKYKIVLNTGQTWIMYVIGNTRLSLAFLNNNIIATCVWSGTLRFTVLPMNNNQNTLNEYIYDAHHQVWPTGGDLSLQALSRTSGSYTLTWKAAGNQSVPLLMYAMKHHIDTLSTTDTSVTVYKSLQILSRIRGNMIAISGNQWTLYENALTTYSFLPWNKVANATKIQIIISNLKAEIYAFSGAEIASGPSNYYSGKGLQKVGMLCLMAEALQLDPLYINDCVLNLQSGIDIYIQSLNGNPLNYDPVWGGLINSAGYSSIGADFYAGFYNDHHFHYGYIVFACAILRHFNDAYFSGNPLAQSFVEGLIRDYANPYANDPYFTQFRMFDFFYGHSWAGGILEDGDGKNEESTSEDINASLAIYLWGVSSNRLDLLHVGQMMLAVSSRVFNAYFYMDPDNNKIMPQPILTNYITGITFENKCDYATYFGGFTYQIHGIHMLPFHSLSECVRNYTWVKKEWNAILKNVVNDPDIGSWKSVLAQNLALIDKEAAWNMLASPSTQLDDGLTRTWALYWAASRDNNNPCPTNISPPVNGGGVFPIQGGATHAPTPAPTATATPTYYSPPPPVTRTFIQDARTFNVTRTIIDDGPLGCGGGHIQYSLTSTGAPSTHLTSAFFYIQNEACPLSIDCSVPMCGVTNNTGTNTLSCIYKYTPGINHIYILYNALEFSGRKQYPLGIGAWLLFNQSCIPSLRPTLPPSLSYIPSPPASSNNGIYTPGPGWYLQWSEEFNSLVVDEEVWTFERGNNNGWGNNELEIYTESHNNAYIQNGNLVIAALWNNITNTFTSARLKTQGKKSFLFGKIVGRIKVPHGQGIWPAFWLLGEDILYQGWPACGEIDILEMIGGDQHGRDDSVFTTLHYANSAGSHTQVSTSTTLPARQKLANDYHLYELEWTNTSMRARLDGVEYWYFNLTSDKQALETFTQSSPFYIILNVAVGGIWPGNPDSTTTFPQYMSVDWIRVYTRDPSLAAPPTTVPPTTTAAPTTTSVPITTVPPTTKTPTTQASTTLAPSTTQPPTTQPPTQPATTITPTTTVPTPTVSTTPPSNATVSPTQQVLPANAQSFSQDGYGSNILSVTVLGGCSATAQISVSLTAPSSLILSTLAVYVQQNSCPLYQDCSIPLCQYTGGKYSTASCSFPYMSANGTINFYILYNSPSFSVRKQFPIGPWFTYSIDCANGVKALSLASASKPPTSQTFTQDGISYDLSYTHTGYCNIDAVDIYTLTQLTTSVSPLSALSVYVQGSCDISIDCSTPICSSNTNGTSLVCTARHMDSNAKYLYILYNSFSFNTRKQYPLGNWLQFYPTCNPTPTTLPPPKAPTSYSTTFVQDQNNFQLTSVIQKSCGNNGQVVFTLTSLSALLLKSFSVYVEGPCTSSFDCSVPVCWMNTNTPSSSLTCTFPYGASSMLVYVLYNSPSFTVRKQYPLGSWIAISMTCPSTTTSSSFVSEGMVTTDDGNVVERIQCMNGGSVSSRAPICTCPSPYRGARCEMIERSVTIQLSTSYTTLVQSLPSSSSSLSDTIYASIENELTKILDTPLDGVEVIDITPTNDDKSVIVTVKLITQADVSNNVLLTQSMQQAASYYGSGKGDNIIPAYYDSSYGVQDAVSSSASSSTRTTTIVTSVTLPLVILAAMSAFLYYRHRQRKTQSNQAPAAPPATGVAGHSGGGYTLTEMVSPPVPSFPPSSFGPFRSSADPRSPTPLVTDEDITHTVMDVGPSPHRRKMGSRAASRTSSPTHRATTTTTSSYTSNQ